MEITNRIVPPRVRLGAVYVSGVDTGVYPAGWEARMASLVADRQTDLPPELEQNRLEARNMLRNGRYKPTGRGKPASEYLIRAASENVLPVINSVVDINNYISLKYLLPASLWDIDRATSDRMVFRLGRPGESYVFNGTGQLIELQDLVTGCALGEDDTEIPAVNPIKDSLATKTTSETQTVGAVIYAPFDTIEEESLGVMCTEFAELLSACGQNAHSAWRVVNPGYTITVR